MSYGLPPKDFKDLLDAGKINVVGVPIPNGVWGCYLNTQVGPFKDVRLRQAVAWVMPYEKILQASLFGRGVDDVRRADDAQGRLAAALPLHDRHRQGEGAGRRGRRPVLDDAAISTPATPPSPSRWRC